MGELILKTQTMASKLTIGAGAMEKVGSAAKELSPNAKVAVVTDSNVAPLYAAQVAESIKSSNLEPFVMELPAGEEYKTLSTVSDIYAFLAQNGFTRSDIIVALGGGVVGDISGFTAATYLRGISSIQIPTTLLAQVDSSVGGKCGVDLPQGKNLVGAFNQPNRVLIDTNVLASLPENIFKDGMAEVIKYGCIFDENLFTQLESLFPGKIPDSVVERCVELKRDVVERDEHDKGDRMLLNFGHTIGHAIEKLGSFTKYSHGAAVAMGMIAAAKLGEADGITVTGTSSRISALLSRYGLSENLPYPAKELVSVMAMDKKNLAGKLNFIMLSKIGSSMIYPVSLENISALMSSVYSA